MKPPATTIGSTHDTDRETSQSSDADLSTFDRKEPRFALAEELGRGGMGRVLAATDVALDRSVAIKQVLSERSDDVARFEREVKITAQLEHPSIVPVHEAGLDPSGRPYYVMRRIDGEQLSARLQGKPTDARIALLPNLLAVADAAAFAHARKIIHRDIKPTNILLGDYGETWLIDWGLARRLDDLDVSGSRPSGASELTRAGHIYGTIAYMAPEQARGERVDERADVYALGATLFHILAGRGPFAGLSDAERIAAAHSDTDRVPLLGNDIAPELIAIVDKAMAPDPAQRYSHAGELATDLRAFLAGKLVAAHDYTFGERVLRFVRRNRLVVLTVAIALLAILFVAVFAFGRVLNAETDSKVSLALKESAEAEAIERAELDRVNRASLLITIDPTRAAALMRGFPTSSKFAQRARDVIAAAAVNGISRGSRVHRDAINALAMSPDGTLLASVGVDGKVVVHGLPDGGARTIAEVRYQLTRVFWVDGKTLIVHGTPQRGSSGQMRGVLLIDIGTGATRAIAEDTELESLWLARPGVLRGRRRGDFSLIEVSIRDGSTRVLAADARFLAGDADLAIIDGTAGLEVVNRDRVIPLERPPSGAGAVWLVAASAKLQRVAALFRNRVIEWNAEDGKLVREWPVDVGTRHIGYGERALYATSNKRVVRLEDTVLEVASSRSTLLWTTNTARGLAVLFEDGSVIVIDRYAYRLPADHGNARAIAGSPTSTLIATGSADGTVRWLDIGKLMPPEIPIPRFARICCADGSHVIIGGGQQIWRVDLATNQITTLLEDAFVDGSVACARIGSHSKLLVFARGVGFLGMALLLDLDNPSYREPVHADLVTFDETHQHLYLARGNDVYVRDETGPERIYWRAPGPIGALAVAGDWVVVVLRDDRVIRVSPRTHEAATIWMRELVEVVPAPTGEVTLAAGSQLYTWSTDGTLRSLRDLKSEIRDLQVFDTGVSLRLNDGSEWYVTRDGVPVRRASKPRASQFSDHRSASYDRNDFLVVRNMATGDAVVREVGGSSIANPYLITDGVIVVREDSLQVYQDVVPASFAGAHDWLVRTTNATIDDSDRVEWPEPGRDPH